MNSFLSVPRWLMLVMMNVVCLLIPSALIAQNSIVPLPPESVALPANLDDLWLAKRQEILSKAAESLIESLNNYPNVPSKALDQHALAVAKVHDLRAVGRITRLDPSRDLWRGVQHELTCEASVEWKGSNPNDHAESILYITAICLDAPRCVFQAAGGGGLFKHEHDATSRATTFSGITLPSRAPPGKYVINAAYVLTPNKQKAQLLDVQSHEFRVLPNPEEASITDHIKRRLRDPLDENIVAELKDALNQIKITDEILLSIPKSERIRELDLSFGQFTNGGLLAVCELPSLEKLSLHAAPNCVDGLANLSKCKTLSWLDISNMPAVDKSIVPLMQLTALEHLNLAFTDISDQAIEHIAAMNSLKNVVVRGCDLSIEGLNRLRKARPDLSIIH